MENNSLKYRHLTEQEIFDYQNQKLSPSEMHRIELHTLECNLCEEAMSGVSKMDNTLRTASIIRELRKKGRKRYFQRKKIFELIGVNTLIVFLFILGILLFLALYLVRM